MQALFGAIVLFTTFVLFPGFLIYLVNRWMCPEEYCNIWHGLHDWDKWELTNFVYQGRCCKRCGQTQTKSTLL